MEKKVYDVKLTFTNGLLGTQSQRELMKEYVYSKTAERRPDLDLEADLKTVPEELEKATTAFNRLNGKPILMAYQFKGFLKHAANVMKTYGQLKSLNRKVEDYVFIAPTYIPFHTNGAIRAADDPWSGSVRSENGRDFLERPLREFARL